MQCRWLDCDFKVGSEPFQYIHFICTTSKRGTLFGK